MRIPDSLYSLVDHGIIEEVVRPLMSGKEAHVYLVVSGGEQRVAKIYKEAQNRTFQNRADYTEGRKVRNSRDQRAMGKGSRHGKAQNEAAWKSTEVDMIYRLSQAGVRVPVPHHFIDGVLIMELVTDAEGFPAPRLGDLVWEPDDAIAVYEQLLASVVRMLSIGVVHGDLSDFNVLMGADGPVIIDFPQSVDASSNQNARKLLLRDVANLHRFLAKFAPDRPALPYAEEMWELYKRNALTADTRLSGRYRAAQKVASTDAVMDLIADAAKDDRRRREQLGLSMRGAASESVAGGGGRGARERGPRAAEPQAFQHGGEQRPVTDRSSQPRQQRGADAGGSGRDPMGAGQPRDQRGGDVRGQARDQRGGDVRDQAGYQRGADVSGGQAREQRGGDVRGQARDLRGGDARGQAREQRGSDVRGQARDLRGGDVRDQARDQRGAGEHGQARDPRGADARDSRGADARGPRAAEPRADHARDPRALDEPRRSDARGGSPRDPRAVDARGGQAHPGRGAGSQREQQGGAPRAREAGQRPLDRREGAAREQAGGRTPQRFAESSPQRRERLGAPAPRTHDAASDGTARESGSGAGQVRGREGAGRAAAGRSAPVHDSPARDTRREPAARFDRTQALQARGAQADVGSRHGHGSEPRRFERAAGDRRERGALEGSAGDAAKQGSPLPDSALGSFTERPASSFGERIPRSREQGLDDRRVRQGGDRNSHGRSKAPQSAPQRVEPPHQRRDRDGRS